MIKNLKKQLNLPLPGKKAQYKMAHTVRINYAPPPPEAQIACVLILFYPKNEDWHFVLIERRSTHKEDRHSGQISFPGGRLEDEDTSLWAGAIREAQEEVGVTPKDIERLGALTDLYIPVSNFLVHPFVGKLDYTPTFIAQPSEVQSVLEVPLSLLQNPKTIRKKSMKISKAMVLEDVPYFEIEGHVVWGATAMILSELLEVLSV